VKLIAYPKVKVGKGQTIIDIVEKREFNRAVNLDSHADKWKEVKTVRKDWNF